MIFIRLYMFVISIRSRKFTFLQTEQLDPFLVHTWHGSFILYIYLILMYIRAININHHACNSSSSDHHLEQWLIGYTLHHLNLSGKAFYVMSSFFQQTANIHGISSRNKLSKSISTTWFSWDYHLISYNPLLLILLWNQASLSQDSLDSGSVSKLEKKGSAPSSAWTNCTSHRCISSNLYSMSTPFPGSFIWLGTTKSITPFHSQKGSEKSTGKPGLDGLCVSCSYYMLWSHGCKFQEKIKERKQWSEY